jgi:hypothetical protein
MEKTVAGQLLAQELQDWRIWEKFMAALAASHEPEPTVPPAEDRVEIVAGDLEQLARAGLPHPGLPPPDVVLADPEDLASLQAIALIDMFNLDAGAPVTH